MRSSRLMMTLVRWLGLTALWIVLVSEISTAELVAGVVAGFLASILAERMHTAAPRLTLRGRWLGRAARSAFAALHYVGLASHVAPGPGQGRGPRARPAHSAGASVMSTRLSTFAVAALALGAVLLAAMAGLPEVGMFEGAYGRLIAAVAPDERQAANIVTAVVFDYRGFDTLMEELILFAAATGVALLLRDVPAEQNAPDREPAPAEERPEPAGARPTEATRWIALALIGAVFLYGVYVIVHGHLSPGGGFQGGVIVAAALLLTFLGSGYLVFQRLAGVDHAQPLEALGAGSFMLAGLVGVGAGEPFLSNVLPLGSRGQLVSTGEIPVLNLAAGMSVTAGILLLIAAFLAQSSAPPRRRRRGRRS